MFGKSSSRQAPGKNPAVATSIRPKLRFKIIAKNCIRFNLPAATGEPCDARRRCGAGREGAHCRRISRRQPVPDLGPAPGSRIWLGMGAASPTRACTRGCCLARNRGERDVMSRVFAAVVVLLMGFWPGSASAQSDCMPYCDFNHDYGPRDFTWAQPGGYGPQHFIYVRPGLFLHPACGPSGYCSPYLLSSSHRSGVRITIRRLGRPVPTRP